MCVWVDIFPPLAPCAIVGAGGMESRKEEQSGNCMRYVSHLGDVNKCVTSQILRKNATCYIDLWLTYLT